MSSNRPSELGPLPLAIEARIDDQCNAFEAAWSAGKRPAIGSFLPQGDEANAEWVVELVSELALIDLEYRWRQPQGNPSSSENGSGCDGAATATLPARPLLDDYVARWPALGPLRELSLDLVKQEYRARRLGGDDPKVEEYDQRFGTGPVLRKALEQVDRQLNQRGVFAAEDRNNVGWASPTGDLTSATHLSKMVGSAHPTDSTARAAELSVRCPHCHGAVSVAADSALSGISCASCGSVFSILGDDDPAAVAPPPTRVAHFELLEQLGAGGFGAVWKARDSQLDRIVAVKIPRKGQLTSAEAQQFLREARAAAQLRHPHVVSVHEVGRDNDVIYIVSDYVPGETIAQRLDRGPLPQATAAELAATIGEALHYAHERGIVHRDLKPANVMLDGEGCPHVMDFGLAKREIGEMTMTVEGKILGTPAYMPPEQARGEGHRADRRSDVYALGVLLYEMLTAQLPFQGAAQLLIVQILNDRPPSPRTHDRRIARDLETIVLKCLEKEPDRRYATAAEAAAELRRFLRGEPILARPISGTERVWRWCRARPLAASLAALSALLIIGDAVVAPFVAVHQAQLRSEADTQRGKAEETAVQLENALREQQAATRAANVERLAAQAAAIAADQPQRAVLLAVEAIELNRRREEPVAHAAQQALRDALANIAGYGAAAHRGPMTALALSTDERWLVTGAEDGTVRIWNVAAAGPIRESREVLGEGPPIYAVAIRPDNRFAAVSNRAGTVMLFDLNAAEPAAQPLVIAKSGATVTMLSFSRDSRWLATGAGKGEITIYNASGVTVAEPSHRIASETRFQGAIRALTFSPHGDELVAAGGATRIVIWPFADGRIDTRRRLSLAVPSPVSHAAYSPDQQQFAAACDDGVVRVWDVVRPWATAAAPEPASATSPRLLRGHRGAISRLAFSLDGQRLATAGTDRTARVWTLADADPAATAIVLRMREPIVRAVAFLHDSRTLLTAGEDKLIRHWDLASGDGASTPIVMRGHEDAIRAIAVGPSGRVYSVGMNHDTSLRVWDIPRRGPSGANPIAASVPRSALRSLAVSSDDKHIVTGGSDGKLRLWPVIPSTATPTPLTVVAAHRAPVTRIAYSSDRRYLASGAQDGSVTLWENHPDGEMLRVRASLPAHQARVSGVAFTPDGRWLLTASWDGTLRQWDLQAAEPAARPHAVHQNGRPLLAMALHPTLPGVIASTEDGKFRAWSLDSQADAAVTALPLPTADGQALTLCCAMTRDGRWLLTGDFQRRVGLWEMTAKKPRSDYLLGHSQPPTHIAVTADDHFIATASFDGTIRVWDRRASRPESTCIVLRGHDSAVNQVAFTSDARWLISASDDGTLRWWPLKLDDLLAHAKHVAGRELTPIERFEYLPSKE